MSENSHGRPFLDSIGQERKLAMFVQLGAALIAEWVAANPDKEYDSQELGTQLTDAWQSERVENRGERIALEIVERFGTDQDKEDLANWLKDNKF